MDFWISGFLVIRNGWFSRMPRMPPIISKHSDPKEELSPGSTISLPGYVVSIISCLMSPTGSLSFPTPPSACEPFDPFSDPDSIAHLLDFTPCHAIRVKVRQLFSSAVNPVSRSHRFFLVVSFSRTSFRLTDLNASVALSACLGVSYDEIGITNLSGRVFKFSVSSKAVGF